MKHKLTGNKNTKNVYLDGVQLDIVESQSLRSHAQEFDWGNVSHGTSQLALAVILKLTGDYQGYSRFKFEVLAGLPANENFELEFDLEYSTIRKKMIREAIACNKLLPKTFLQGKTNVELLCFVHPTYRDQYAYSLGLKKSLSEGSVNYY
jgi:hypothetical protein